MNSGGHRFFTVVTIITLIFGPVFSHHKWVYQLLSQTSETQLVPCAVHKPCPAQKTIINSVYLPLPTDPPKLASEPAKDKVGKKNDTVEPTPLSTASAP